LDYEDQSSNRERDWQKTPARARFQMSRATPQMRSIAERLIAFETRENKFSGIKTPAAFLVCEKLRPQLAILAGSGGFHALLSRAFALANPEVPWLRTVHINADGSLEGLEELHAQLDRDELFEGGVVLVAQLLGLLVAFIGENLTLRLLREVWPRVPLDDLVFGNGDQYEKTK
jgi:hypothetical protein